MKHIPSDKQGEFSKSGSEVLRMEVLAKMNTLIGGATRSDVKVFCLAWYVINEHEFQDVVFL